jgi:hypothetical protein
MHLVALTRWNPDKKLDQELPVLAPALHLAPYDARLRLVTPPPAVLASGLELAAAQQLLGVLRARGHGAVACDVTSVPPAERSILVRGFELGPEVFVGLDEQRRRFELPYAQILGFARAAELSSQTQSVETSEKKLAIGRALMSGGMMMNKTVTKVETTGSSERQQVAYVFRSTAPEPVLLKQYSLSYEGLGAARGSSAHQSFEALIAALRTRTPGAMHDDRLLTHKRLPDLTGVRGLTKDRTISTSNAPANALAAHLLMLGHLQGQL